MESRVTVATPIHVMDRESAKSSVEGISLRSVGTPGLVASIQVNQDIKQEHIMLIFLIKFI